MDLFDNPFYILSVTTRDDRRRITELADEQSLLHDPDLCTKARAELTNPQKRLSAEISWLPGLSPTKAKEALLFLESDVEVVRKMETPNDIVRLNLLCAGLSRLQSLKLTIIAEWIFDIALTFDRLDADAVCRLINEERITSGFPEVTNLLVASEINNRRQYCKGVINGSIAKLSFKERVAAITFVVVSATEDGKEQGPILIHDLVDSYELESQTVLERCKAEIEEQVKNIKNSVDTGAGDDALSLMTGKLLSALQEWDDIAQPVQLSKKSLGVDHDASLYLAGCVRGLAIQLFNEHGKLDLAQQINTVLQKLFDEVPFIAEKTAEDADIYESHKKARAKAKVFDALEPVTRAPTLRSINGIGFSLYGATDPDKETGSVMATYYFVVFFIPIFPICRYRVIKNNRSFGFLGKAPLRDVDKWHLGISLSIIGIFFLYGIFAGGNNSSNSSYTPSQYQTPTSPSTYSPPNFPASPYVNEPVPGRSFESENTQKLLSLEIETAKGQLKELESQVGGMDEQLKSYKSQIDSDAALGNDEAYNALIPTYNALVNERKDAYEKYKKLLADINQKIDQYNAGIHRRPY